MDDEERLVLGEGGWQGVAEAAQRRQARNDEIPIGRTEWTAWMGSTTESCPAIYEDTDVRCELGLDHGEDHRARIYWSD